MSVPETLSKKQRRMTVYLSRLIAYANMSKMELTLGEAYRTPEQAALNAKAGTGISNSLHTKRLAIDLNLFIDDVYQTDSAAYQRLGDYWKGISDDCRWGGDFSKPDGNHFSIEHEGVK